MPSAPRYNLCTNPSFETAVTGWAGAGPGSGAPTIAQSSVMAWPSAGTKCAVVTWTTATDKPNGVQSTFSTSSGTTYTASAWVYVPGGNVPVAILVNGLATSSWASTVTDQWTRISVTFTAVSSTQTVRVWATQNQIAGQLFYLDAVLCEAASTAMPYFDGDTSGAVWSGTAELSTSTLNAFDPGNGMPTVVVEFDATAPQATDFVLDSSALNSGNLLIGSPRFVTVPSEINSLTITRGVTVADAPPTAGEATIEFDNWSGNFDPDNTLSVYNQQPNNPQLVPGMQVRVSTLFANGGAYTAQTIFWGTLESVSIDVGIFPTATFTVVDDLATIGQSSIPSFNSSVNASSDGSSAGRVRWALNQSPQLCAAPVVSSSMTRQILPTYGGDSILDEIVAAATAEAGRVFCSRLGAITVTSHGDEYTQIPLATLSDSGAQIVNGVEYESLAVTNGVQRIINAATVERYGSPSNYQTMYGGNSSSAFRYGTQSYSVVAPLTSDSDAQALATYLGNRFSTPIPLIDSVTVNFAGQGNAAVLLGADIGNQVTVTRIVQYQSGSRTIALRLVIIGMRWDISATGGFSVTLYTGPVDITSLYGSAGAFILNSSLLNGTDTLTPY